MTDDALLQRVFGYALSLCHERAEALDLVQEAWLRSSRYPVRTPQLLVRVVRNLWFEQGRRAKLVVLDPNAEHAVGGEPDVTAHQLERFLSSLEPNVREVLYLMEVEGYTAAETAELMDRPRNTVLSWLRRGKASLRVALEVGDEPREQEVGS